MLKDERCVHKDSQLQMSNGEETGQSSLATLAVSVEQCKWEADSRDLRKNWAGELRMCQTH